MRVKLFQKMKYGKELNQVTTMEVDRAHCIIGTGHARG